MTSSPPPAISYGGAAPDNEGNVHEINNVNDINYYDKQMSE